jgi:hypothetical protein
VEKRHPTKKENLENKQENTDFLITTQANAWLYTLVHVL